MAGEGSRFGYKFKPFIKATDMTFIELAKTPFDFLKPTYVFVFRDEQERHSFVSQTLLKLFPNDDILLCIIKSSKGPLDTAQQAITKLGLKGPGFVCDCDHSIDVTPMFKHIGTKFDALVPIWRNIEPDQYHSWGKVKFNSKNEIVSFHEKEIPDLENGEYFEGLIGCHLFSNIEKICEYPAWENFSTMYKEMFKNHDIILSVEITKASFFGTPKLLETFRFKRAQTYTLFIDIEGTIIDQDTKIPLPNAINTLSKWRLEGHKIILTTASNVEIDSKIPHDLIIRDLSSGPRIIINDRKPYLPYYKMADGIQLERNYGIQDIDLNAYKPPVILKELKGGSGDRIFVIENNRVRKWSNNKKLKKQYEHLKLMSEIIPHVIPKIYEEYETSTDYCYDMEYLEGYKTLTHFERNVQEHVVSILIKNLKNDMYSVRRPIPDPASWLNSYINKSVFPRLKEFENLVILRPTIRSMFETMNLQPFLPKYESIIHGDLTYENILWNPETETFKLIDPNCSKYFEPYELDLGKLLQSEICYYESWGDGEIPEKFFYGKKPIWISDTEFNVSLFYMITHLIRLIPYIIKRSEKGAKIALILAHSYLLRLKV
jgi:hypothetical protein